MTERNKDGLVPGQLVDFETIQRIESERKAKQEAEQKTPVEEQEAAPEKTNRARK